MKMEIAKGSNKSRTQRSSPLHLLSAVGLLSMLFTRRHIHLLFIPNYSPSLIRTPRVNEVGVRGRESGGLMDLIRGVALIISGETTRYGVREAARERKREAGRGRTIAMSLFTVARCPWEDGGRKGRERQREDEKRDGGKCWAVTDVAVLSLWFISISASEWPERQFHMCELSETPCLRRDKRLQHSLSLSLSPSFLHSFPGRPLALHLGSEKVHIFIYKSWNSHIFHLAYLVIITAQFICFFVCDIYSIFFTKLSRTSSVLLQVMHHCVQWTEHQETGCLEVAGCLSSLNRIISTCLDVWPGGGAQERRSRYMPMWWQGQLRGCFLFLR